MSEEVEWTWYSLEALFETQFGKACGNKSLAHGEDTITRSVRRQPSNSGKTHTWKIDYVVKRATGEIIAIDDPNKAVNRANDPDRNWGLGRE